MDSRQATNGSNTEDLSDILLDLEEHWDGDGFESFEEVLSCCPLSLRQRVEESGHYTEIASQFAALRKFQKGVPPSPMALRSVQPRIPGFEILDELDRGGMGTVYRARQISVDRLVAIKVVSAGRLAPERVRERFQREAEAVGRLRHANIVQIHRAGETEGLPYLVLEYVEGGNLAQHLGGRLVDARQSAEWARQIASAVHYAHQEGILHRDLKPSNILLQSDNTIKVSDFGLAKRLGDNAALTRTGEALGTPGYMPPELLRGHEPTPASDVYAIGVILYESLTGRLPFVGRTPAETLFQIDKHEPLKPRRLCPSIPVDLEAVCLKCLEKNPSRRYATAGEFAADLNRWLEGSITEARPAGPARRVANYCRRKPVVATLVAVTCLALITLAGGGWWHGIQMRMALQREQTLLTRAIENRDWAVASEQHAVAEKQRAELLLYLAKLHQAQSAWTSDSVRAFFDLHAEAKQLEPPALAESFPGRYLDRLAGADRIKIENNTPHLFAARYVDPDTIATGDEAGMIRLWDAATGRIQRELEGHSSCVNSLAVSPDGRFLASASCDGTIRIWSLDAEGAPRILHSPWGPVGTVRFSDDGQSLFSCSIDHSLLKWDTDTARIARELVPPHQDLEHAIVSRSGNWIATVDTDKHSQSQIRWWPVAERGAMKAVPFSCPIGKIAFANDGKRIAAAADDGRTLIWNVNDSETGKEFFDSIPTDALAFSHDDSLLAAAGVDGIVRLWDVESRTLVCSMKGYTHRVMDLSFSSSDENLLLALENGQAEVFPIQSQIDFERMNVDLYHVSCAALSPDADWLAIGHSHGLVDLYHLGSPRFNKRLIKGWDGIQVDTIRFSADGRFLEATWRGHLPELRYRCWEVKGTEIKLRRQIPDRLIHDLNGAHNLRAVDGDTTSELVVQQGDASEELRFAAKLPISFARFDSKGEVVYVDASGNRSLWELSSGRPNQLLVSSNSARTMDCAFSPVGDRIAVAYSDRVEIFDRHDGKIRAVFRSHAGPIRAIAYSPCGQFIASGGDSGQIRIWHADTGQEALTLEGHEGPVLTVRFDPSGKSLYSVGRGQGPGLSLLRWPTEP